MPRQHVVNVKPLPPPAVILDQRVTKNPLRDVVVDAFRELIDKQPTFHRLQEAVNDSDAVEGTVRFDEFMSCQMIREVIKARDPTGIGATEPIRDLIEPYRYACKLHKIGRAQRRKEAMNGNGHDADADPA